MCLVYALIHCNHLTSSYIPILTVAGGAVISITVVLVWVCFCVVYTSKCVEDRKVDLTLRKDLTLKVRRDIRCDVP